MLAIPVFRSRVAPVLNWCSRICIFPQERGECELREEVMLLNMSPFDRLRVLHDEGVRTLICGALSPDLLNYGETIGLDIIDGVAGDVSDVLQAYHSGELDSPGFWLPGYHGPHRGRKGR